MQTVEEIALEQLGEHLCFLRLCPPDAVQKMQSSLLHLGQLSPLLAYGGEDGAVQLIDGFKRLRAAEQLRWPALRVEVLQVDAVGAKLRMVRSNESESLSELEQAWLIRSLYRDDGLTQPAIAQLFGRHKSWVSRRLMLAETLSEELQADVRLGVLSSWSAAQLCRLPRGNQRQVGQVVARRGLTTRQTAKLVDGWLEASDEQTRQNLLQQAGVLSGAEGKKPDKVSKKKSAAEWMVVDIDTLCNCSARLQARLMDGTLSSLAQGAAELLLARLEQLRAVLVALVRTIDGVKGQR